MPLRCRRIRTVRPPLGAALLTGALLLTGCAADSSESADAAPSAPATSAPATTADSVATPLPPPVDPFAGQPLIDHTTWTEGRDGARLLVFPTAAGRATTFPDAGARAWQEVLAQRPDAGTPGMRDQFLCHFVWARAVVPNKESWNLEPWRPDVGYQATVQANCNPGGPER